MTICSFHPLLFGGAVFLWITPKSSSRRTMHLLKFFVRVLGIALTVHRIFKATKQHSLSLLYDSTVYVIKSKFLQDIGPLRFSGPKYTITLAVQFLQATLLYIFVFTHEQHITKKRTKKKFIYPSSRSYLLVMK